MAGNSNVIELVLKTSRTGTGIRDVKSELSGLQQATKAAGSTFTSFGASGKDAYGALLQTGRAAGMSQGEINQFASSLGVASSAEVEATSKMHSLISAWDAGDISSEQLTEGLGELGEGADDAAESAQGLGNVIDTAMAAAITKGAIEAGKMVYELAELGAQSLRTKAAFAAISGGADEATANLEAMQRATRGAISETEMMAQASRLMQMGLVDSAAELEYFSEMAVRLGTAMGRDATASIEELSLTMANLSYQRLDTFGISSGRVRERVGELKDEIAGLSTESAFWMATMEAGEVAMARLGPVVEDDALAFEQATAKAADLRVELGERLAPAVTRVLNAGLQLLTWNSDLTAALIAHESTVRTTADGYNDYITELERAAGVVGLTIDEQGNLVRVYQAHGREVRELVEEEYALTEATWDAGLAQEALAGQLARGGAATEQFTASTGYLEDKLRRTAIAFHETRDGADAAQNAISEAADVAGESSGLFGGLADSVIDLGNAFTQGIPDADQMYGMMLSVAQQAGMTASEIEEMAISMGVAEQSEIDAQLAAYAAIEAFKNQEMSAASLSAMTQLLEKHSGDLAMAEEAQAAAANAAVESNAALAEEYQAEADALFASADAALNQAIAISGTGEAATDAQGKAEEYREGLLSIPSEIRTRVETNLARQISQAERLKRLLESIGGHEATGGVGPGSGGITENQYGAWDTSEGLAYIHAREMVVPAIPASRIRQSTRNDNRSYSRGGDTIVVMDTLASAMVLEQRHRALDANLARGF